MRNETEMIRYLKTSTHKGIKAIKLYDLSKINIVCGKNNSGKSALLEGLQNAAIRGKIFMDSNFFFEHWTKMYTNRDHSFHKAHNALFNEFFEELLNKNNRVIFTDEVGTIVDSLITRLSAYPYSNFRTGDPTVLNHVFKIIFANFEDNIAPILIPAKRILESEVEIRLELTSSPDGKGVLTHLFFLKNQDLSSENFVLYQEIHKIFKEITGYEFNVVPSNNNTIALKFRINSQWLHADQCGLGLRELLTMISFIYTTRNNLILLEEPENHLHADFQKKFIAFLKNCADKQFIIATHSNIFIDNNYVDKIFHVWFEDEVKVSDKTSISKIIDSLGYSIAENLVSDAIILTEGPTDVPLLKRILGINGVLNNYNVKFWPLGGDIMGSTDLTLFSGLDKVFAIIDTDPKSMKVRNLFIKNCKAVGITCFKLERYAIENYVPLKVYKSQFPEISKNITELENDKNIDEQFGFKTNNKSVKGKNYELALKVSNEDLIGTDLLKHMDAIKSFLDNK
jgi:predicted ATP-dependent endonuclease of OLD family